MPEPKVGVKSFDALHDLTTVALVFMGVGGSTQEWVDGVADILVKEGIVTKQPVFSEAYVLSGNVRGPQGRRDLVMVFPSHSHINMGKLAIWRLDFGDVSWADDFVANYGRDYLYESPIIEDKEDE